MPQIIRLALAVFVGGTIVFAALQWQRMHTLQQNSVLAAQQEIATTLKQVGRLIELPQRETPTVATVADITKLKNQPFFSHAENGDKILIYAQAKEAILYRPSIDKIIVVSPITIQSPTVIPSVISVTPTNIPTPTSSFRQFTLPHATQSGILSPSLQP